MEKLSESEKGFLTGFMLTLKDGAERVLLSREGERIRIEVDDDVVLTSVNEVRRELRESLGGESAEGRGE